MPVDKNGKKIEVGDIVRMPTVGVENPFGAGLVSEVNDTETIPHDLRAWLLGLAGYRDCPHLQAKDCEVVLKHTGELP